MEIRKKLVDPSKYGTKCPYTMNPEFITVHNTYNDATAENEVSYMIRNDNQVSFHIAVDDKEAVQGIPLERNAWHTGDGNGNGNRKSIGVEICYSLSGGDRYYKAEDNAAIVVAQLMKQYNIPINKVRTHQSWSGKYCPHRMLAEGRWNNFIEGVQNAYNGDGKVTPTRIPPSNNGTGIAYIEGNGINLRKGPGTGYGGIRQLGKGESYEVWGQSNGWLNLGGNQWIKNDPSYVKFNKKSTVDSSIVGKRVISKVNNLRFYDAPSWQDKDVAGSVDAGLGFTIDAKVNVNGSPQYKVHNSKGKTYYVTANEAYVYVE
ncbi:N-acetylmuramoyl-L-alanine amidase [Bacillus cereus]|uniref:N-acetylmuramoyl-L-alanine amidase n=1 Tax=Bacillus TaxID=1386 RepID=UPI000BFA1E05|nr:MULTISPECIES: N-acetylmuramoyl-L-alanine amidase [Bacillus cereus group]MCU5204553.1 N-acetylmuramoyl-L-alanine amidase [Bacillus paranthracis]MDA2163682.1 N-acetylmuramoyl-L-alanine amidase [Bacillus cereus group sp. Bc252]MDF9511786.1 N-acetylmuramoyl-L-alanine amidase [Bacillus paranthracis]MDF9671371.1 N-acetylmuramoyl-L-alanine amidase [Bacillus paranthracis]MDG1611036.1 N-acetylmuramoyl-L-alanine amidase [Bacillus paranthracis]